MALPGLPMWATDPEALVEEPTSEKQAQGWTTDTGTPEGVGEKPPLEYFNWLAKQTYLCLQALYATVGGLPTFGTMASQNANNVNIAGGSITGTNLNNLIVTGMVMPFRGAVADVPTGWIPEMVGTIGNAASGGTIRANADVQALYVYYWTNYPSIKSTVSGGTTGTALGDFNANKTLNLSDLVARVNAPYGLNPNVTGASTFTLGEAFGEQSHPLTEEENGPHGHSFTHTGGTGDAGVNNIVATNDGGFPPESPNGIQFSGSGTPHNTMQPTIFCVQIVKL